MWRRIGRKRRVARLLKTGQTHQDNPTEDDLPYILGAVQAPSVLDEEGRPYRFTMCSGVTRDARGEGSRRDALCKTRVGLMQERAGFDAWDWKAHWRKLTQLDLQFIKDERKSDPNFNIIQVADSLGQMATPWYLVQPEDVLSTDRPVTAPDEQTGEKMMVVRPFSFTGDTIHSLSPKTATDFESVGIGIELYFAQV